METCFAPAERSSSEQLRFDLDLLTRNPLITTMLNTASGLLAVLNEQRQVLALNDAFLRMLGVRNAGEVLGLRPGEAVRCVYAHDKPGGCGTGRYCPTCGAAISILAALASNRAEERKCALVIERNGERMELCLRVRAAPLDLSGRRLLLFFLQDITVSERWAEAERIFFHDLNNILTALRGWAELLPLKDEGEMRRAAEQIQECSMLLVNEVALQRSLLREELSEYQCSPQEVSVGDVVDSLSGLFASHPAAQGRQLTMVRPPAASLTTDLSLLLRVLTNMLTNALEATPEGGVVKLWVEPQERNLVFCVWNQGAIPPEAALRVFQRHFSTKAEYGRGVGTYAMKLFGERLLGGKVDFETSPAQGTVFRLRLPTGS